MGPLSFLLEHCAMAPVTAALSYLCVFNLLLSCKVVLNVSHASNESSLQLGTDLSGWLANHGHLSEFSDGVWLLWAYHSIWRNSLPFSIWPIEDNVSHKYLSPKAVMYLFVNYICTYAVTCLFLAATTKLFQERACLKPVVRNNKQMGRHGVWHQISLM